VESRYDTFYEGEAAGVLDPHKGRFPRGRDEAIVAVPGGGNVLLDIGCGDGALLYAHRRRFNTLIGLEYSTERLRQAESNLAGLDVVLCQGSAESLREIKAESVDRIVTSDVVEHIPDIYAAVKEMHRVLRPGGLLVMNTPNVAYVKRRAQLLAGRFPSTSQPNEGLGSDILFDGGHLHYFTYRSLRLLLEGGGFRMVSRQAYGRFGRIHALYPPLTSVGVQWVAARQTE
jgi:SAM-dependent methyltransferase